MWLEKGIKGRLKDIGNLLGSGKGCRILLDGNTLAVPPIIYNDQANDTTFME